MRTHRERSSTEWRVQPRSLKSSALLAYSSVFLRAGSSTWYPGAYEAEENGGMLCSMMVKCTRRMHNFRSIPDNQHKESSRITLGPRRRRSNNLPLNGRRLKSTWTCSVKRRQTSSTIDGE